MNMTKTRCFVLFAVLIHPVLANAFMFDDFLINEFERMDRVSRESMKEVIRQHRENAQKSSANAQKKNVKKSTESPRIKQLRIDAMNAFHSGDFKTALKIEKQLLSEGAAGAYGGLANHYENGLGVKKDLEQAFAYYYQGYLLEGKNASALLRVGRPLARGGNVLAAKVIGLIHLNNAEKAALEIKENKKINMFIYGRLDRELKEAIEYLEKAFGMGDKESAMIIAKIYNSKNLFPDFYDLAKHDTWVAKAKK